MKQHLPLGWVKGVYTEVVSGLHLALCGTEDMEGSWDQTPGAPMSCQSQGCILGGAEPEAGNLQGWKCLLMLEWPSAAASAGPTPAQISVKSCLGRHRSQQSVYAAHVLVLKKLGRLC